MDLHFETSKLFNIKNMNRNEIKGLKPLLVYKNAGICKELILQENSGKCGIYR